jgi:xanthine dehydrogenase accessory factor
MKREKLLELLESSRGAASHLVICGGGYVGLAVLKIGRMTGFSVTVLEDRPSFADEARAAGADRVICDDFVHGLAQIPGGKQTFFVIVTRGHRYDSQCLLQILKKEYAYIGMMGSRRRIALLKNQLLEQGVSRELLEQLHAPIGLDIGAETPEEIGVSILAQILQEKNKNGSQPVLNEEQQALLRQALLTEEPLVLATIIAREGSAPRGVGTRMLVRGDGGCAGTIGGGCMEAQVLMEARNMFRGTGEKKCLRVSLTTDDAEKEGMVCGGNIDVLLELI